MNLPHWPVIWHTVSFRGTEKTKIIRRYLWNTLSTMIEWSKLHPNIRNSLLNLTFKKQILEFASLSPNSIFSNFAAAFAVPWFKLSYRIASWFKPPTWIDHYNIWNLVNPICDCGKDTETTKHLLLHCQNFSYEKRTLLQNIRKLIPFFILLFLNENSLPRTLSYGIKRFTDVLNTRLLNSVIEYVLLTKRFDNPFVL